MIEVYMNPKFQDEAHLLKERVKNFNYFQIVSPVEFQAVNAKNEIKIENNHYHKKFNIIAN